MIIDSYLIKFTDNFPMQLYRHKCLELARGCGLSRARTVGGQGRLDRLANTQNLIR